METLASVLKKRREELRLTLREVEEKTGVSNAYLSQLENQKIAKPSPSVLRSLADAYRLPYAHLLELAGHPAVSWRDRRATVFRTSSGLEQLTKEEEKQLLDYLRFLRTRRSSER